MDTVGAVQRLICTAIENVSRQNLEKAVKCINGGSHAASVPVLSSDRDMGKFIQDYQLQNPDKLIRFLVGLHFAIIDELKDSTEFLKYLKLNDTIALVNSANTELMCSVYNPREKNRFLQKASERLTGAIEVLQGQAELYINEIRKHDQMGRLEFFLKSRVSLKTLDTNVFCAKVSIKAVLEAFQLQLLISAQLGINPTAYVESFMNHTRILLSDDNCRLMHAYDKDNIDEFWLTLPSQITEALEEHDTVQLIMEVEKKRAEDERNAAEQKRLEEEREKRRGQSKPAKSRKGLWYRFINWLRRFKLFRRFFHTKPALPQSSEISDMSETHRSEENLKTDWNISKIDFDDIDYS